MNLDIMKKNFFVTLLVFSILTFSQNDKGSRFTSNLFVDLNASNNSSYEYYDQDKKPKEISVNGKGSLELTYNLDYRIINKLSATAILGLTNFNGPLFASFKTGLGFKLLYTPDYSYNFLTIQYGYHIPFDRNDFREGHHIKIGQVFDVINIFSKRLLVGLFYNFDFFYMEKSKTLTNHASSSFSYDTSSFGISLGIKF